jgi:hypothetical protein
LSVRWNFPILSLFSIGGSGLRLPKGARNGCFV